MGMRPDTRTQQTMWLSTSEEQMQTTSMAGSMAVMQTPLTAGERSLWQPSGRPPQGMTMRKLRSAMSD